MDTLQQMVADIFSKAHGEKDKGPSGEGRRPKWRRTKAQVEKDEGPEAETQLSILIVAEGQD